jgi:peptide-methionine (S)-S-oxide reductase
MPCRDWKGLSYRSAIFYTSPEQKRTAAATIADVEACGLWPGKIVTEVSPAGAFWEAEPEHQDYLQRIPDGAIPALHAPRLETALQNGAGLSGASAVEYLPQT